MDTETVEIKKNKVQPKLRFWEFKEDWQLRKFGDITIKVGSGSTPRGGSEVYQDNGIPFIRSQNVTQNQLILDNTFISEEINEQMKGSIVHPNDVLLNITGASIGRSCLVPKDFKIGNVNQHVCIIRLNSKYDPKFIQVFLSSTKGQRLVDQGQTGSGREGLNFQSIRLFKSRFPSLQEQQKIASFLSAVDKKIQKLSRKKELLKTYKKGVMQQLFSKKLRLKDDDRKEFPEWREQKLKDVCSFFSGGTPTSTNKKFYSGTIPFIGSGNINDYNVSNFISEEAYNSSSAKLVEVGDILYALYGANSGEIAISRMAGAINQAILCIRTNLNTNYLYYLLSYNQEKIVAKYLQGGQGNLSANIIKNLKYNFPSEQEQQKIAEFLSAVDKKIETVSQQIEKTQCFKKGLLQQMFV